MATLTEVTSFNIGHWYNVGTITSSASATATYGIKVSNAFKDKDGAVITGNFFMNVLDTSNNFVERIYVPANGVSADGLTIGVQTTGEVTRGLKPTGINPTDGSSTYSFKLRPGMVVACANDPVFLNMVLQALLGNIGMGLKLNARNTFMGTGILACRAFTNAAARDAAIVSPSNGDMAYLTAEGKFTDYVAGAWADRASGTNPNASTTVAGRVEIATQAENNAGTATGGTGASLAATPDLNAKSVQDSKWVYAADSVGSDSYAITLVPAITAYAVGQVFHFKAGTANTGAATLNVNSLGAITIKKAKDQDLATGDIESGQIVTVAYDGTNFQMQSQTAATPLSASILTAKGSLISASAASTPAEVTVGSNFKNLSADSNATNGVSWQEGFGFGRSIHIDLRDMASAVTGTSAITHYGNGSTLDTSNGVGDDAVLQSQLVGTGNAVSHELAFSVYDASQNTEGDYFMGFYDTAIAAIPASSTSTARHVGIFIDYTNSAIYCSVANNTTQSKSSDVKTQFRALGVCHVKIVYTLNTSALFYINGTLVATINTNVPNITPGYLIFGATTQANSTGYHDLKMLNDVHLTITAS